jgi:hypothetical protein
MLNSDVMQRAVVSDKLMLISAAFQELEVIFLQHVEYLTLKYFIAQNLNLVLPTHFLKLRFLCSLPPSIFVVLRCYKVKTTREIYHAFVFL